MLASGSFCWRIGGILVALCSTRWLNSTLDRLLNLPRQVSLPEDVPPDPAIWSRYAGHYWSHVNGIAMVRVVEDQLRLDWNGWKVALRPLADDRYIGQDVSLSVRFVADAAGTIRHLLIGLPGWSMTFGRADPAFVPDPAGWQQYAGVYLLDDDLVDYVEKLNVRVADGKIWFNIDTEGDEEALGVPIGETAFATRYGLFEFQLAGGVQSAKFADEFMYVKS